MAYSRVTYLGDGSSTIFTVPFEYLKKSFVKVVVAEEPVASDAVEWLSATSIKLAVIPASGSTIYIYRDTEKNSPVTDYRNGAVLTGTDLDSQTRQLLHIAQETQDVADEQMRLDSHDRKYDAQNRIIKNVADPVDDTDAMTLRTWKLGIQPSIDASLAQVTVKVNQAEASAVNANSSALLASGQATISGQHARESETSAITAALSSTEAKAAAEEAKATLPTNFLGRVEALETSSAAIGGRVTATETKNATQDNRLTAVESGVTAISTTLIGSIQTMLCADSYVPNGTVPANGGEYTQAQFPSFYDTYLATGKLLTCTYAAWAAQVGLTGNCAKFAVDADNKKFKVPLIKDGDSITQASSAAELGKSVKAGLPDLIGATGGTYSDQTPPTGVFYSTATAGGLFGSGSNPFKTNIFKASAYNAIYGNSNTVTDEQIRLRHFVVVASAQNNASVFDWSNYMAGLAGKANVDFSNTTNNAIGVYLYVRDEKTSGTDGGTSAGSAWQTRDLNTTVVNRINGASLGSNRITLPAGKYHVKAVSPVYAVGLTRIGIYSVTSGQYLCYGNSDKAHTYEPHVLMLEDEFTLSAQAQIELRVYTQTAISPYGLGFATSLGVAEQYSGVHIWKV